MLEDILKYKSNDSRFHMPGHSGVDIDGELYSVAGLDVTELDFTDNLQHPTGVIREVEEEIARAYHAKRALMLTQGATAGIETALLVAREKKGKLYLLGDTHKSCISFASIIGLGIEMIESVDRAVELAKKGEWIYVTTPNYYGEIIEIEPILRARAKGSCVIVDEAHGAHFVFCSLLPRSTSDRADFVVESLHKTLPVFTGGAVLCVNNESYIDMSEYFKNKIHSTSPSYLIMQSIEYAIRYMSKKGEMEYSKIFNVVNNFRARLDDRYDMLYNDDFSRVVLECGGADKVAMYLESKGVYVELFDEKRIVFIVTPFNVDKLDNVLELLRDYDGDMTKVETDKIIFDLDRAKNIEGELRFLPLDEAEGKVSMSEVGIYPPGVPIVRTGDILTREVLEFIKENRERIVGLTGDTIAVRDICKEN